MSSNNGLTITPEEIAPSYRSDIRPEDLETDAQEAYYRFAKIAEARIRDKAKRQMRSFFLDIDCDGSGTNSQAMRALQANLREQGFRVSFYGSALLDLRVTVPHLRKWPKKVWKVTKVVGRIALAAAAVGGGIMIAT